MAHEPLNAQSQTPMPIPGPPRPSDSEQRRLALDQTRPSSLMMDDDKTRCNAGPWSTDQHPSLPGPSVPLSLLL